MDRKLAWGREKRNCGRTVKIPAVDETVEELRCVHRIYLRVEGTEVVPASICSNPAGLVHMHDCPVAAGRECAHHEPLEGDSEAVTPQEFEDLHERLMDDFLTRTYHHRVRSLSPRGHPWLVARERTHARYTGEEEQPEEQDEAERALARYEKEADRLRTLRRKREETRRLKEEQEKKEKLERAMREAEERAARAARERKSTEVTEAPRRRRRRGRRGPRPEQRPARPAPDAAAEPPKKRRRRGRRRRGGGRTGGDGNATSA
jgi:hypothetical protein